MIIVGLSIGCQQKAGDESHASHDHSQHDPYAHNEDSLGTSGPSDLSLYNNESFWIDHRGDTVRLGSLAGKVQVVSMIYTSCEYTCPRIIADLKKIETLVPRHIGFVLISIDPERDTPQKLESFASENDLKTNWVLLHGNSDNVLEVAAMMGVQYKRSSPTDFSHSNILTVLNTHGEIVFQQKGLGEVEETVLAVNKAAAEPQL